MKRIVLHFVVMAAVSAFCGDLDVARQALADGVWRSALAAADAAAVTTNATDRTAARLVSLEALAYLEDDAEIRRRLAEWKDETSESFRYWKARSFVRVGDFEQAQSALNKPFSDAALTLPAATLKAAVLMALDKPDEALQAMSGQDVQNGAGLAGEDARMVVAEALGRTGRRKEAQEILADLAKGSVRREIRLRSGFLLGFSEMDDSLSYTGGVARVRALLRANPGEGISEFAARAFADRLLRAGDAAGAEDEYRRYLEIFPSAAMDPVIIERRGQAFLMMGRNSEAAGTFARAEQTAKEAEDKSRLAYLQGSAYVADGKLSCQLYQRSADVFLGVPFNIASYALLTMMIAQVCGLEVGDFVHTTGDTHIYTNHFEQVETQLSREPRALPKMKINPEVKSIFDFKYEDFELVDYDPYPRIPAPVAV